MTPKVFVEKICGCGKTFKTSNNSEKCYDCTLKDFTNSNPPEEGDFYTAGIVSGTLTDQERYDMQQDLERIELGRTTQEEEDEDPDDFDWGINAQNRAARFGEEG